MKNSNLGYLVFRLPILSVSTLSLLFIGSIGGSISATAAEQMKDRPNPGTPKVQTEVSVKELNKHPERFAGSEIVVTGKVAKVEGPGAFILEGSGLFNNRILAVVTKPSGTETHGKAPVIKEKEKLRLIGKVEEIGVTKVEETFGPLKSEIKTEFEGVMPVLVVAPSGFKTVS